ncbi:MAG: GntR family transcriptional regulator, partial [Acidobacteria bacterium]|nr:GntR family transcriptional regulator [Acidobacteriota bacterium]
MVLRLERDSVVPPYEQLRAQLTVMVAAGLLEPGTRLPTVRSLAEHLSLSPGTTARAYRELEASGYVVTRGRRGSFIADEPPRSEPLEERRRRLAEAADTFAASCEQLGI